MDIVISIPHGSDHIPSDLHEQFLHPHDRFRFHEDHATDKIFNFDEYPTVMASASRFVADVNRRRDQLDEPQGAIIFQDWDGGDVHARPLSEQEVEQRLQNHYDSYYAHLTTLISSAKSPFVLDCHSMDSTGGDISVDPGNDRPDICLADAFGKMCDPHIVNLFKEEFERYGFSVGVNDPYCGVNARIVNFAKAHGAQSLELELNKKIYMDEDTLELDDGAIHVIQAIVLNVLRKIEAL